eukprot:g191.t1
MYYLVGRDEISTQKVLQNMNMDVLVPIAGGGFSGTLLGASDVAGGEQRGVEEGVEHGYSPVAENQNAGRWTDPRGTTAVSAPMEVEEQHGPEAGDALELVDTEEIVELFAQPEATAEDADRRRREALQDDFASRLQRIYPRIYQALIESERQRRKKETMGVTLMHSPNEPPAPAVERRRNAGAPTAGTYLARSLEHSLLGKDIFGEGGGAPAAAFQGPNARPTSGGPGGGPAYHPPGPLPNLASLDDLSVAPASAPAPQHVNHDRVPPGAAAPLPTPAEAPADGGLTGRLFNLSEVMCHRPNSLKNWAIEYADCSPFLPTPFFMISVAWLTVSAVVPGCLGVIRGYRNGGLRRITDKMGRAGDAISAATRRSMSGTAEGCETFRVVVRTAGPVGWRSTEIEMRSTQTMGELRRKIQEAHTPFEEAADWYVYDIPDLRNRVPILISDQQSNLLEFLQKKRIILVKRPRQVVDMNAREGGLLID